MADDALTPEEVEVFARGLYYIAAQDGIDERETELIKEFLADANSELQVGDLDGDFSPLEAAQILDTTFLRRIFLKLAVALVRADGVYSENERVCLGAFADAFEISNAEFGQIESSARELTL